MHSARANEFCVAKSAASVSVRDFSFSSSLVSANLTSLVSIISIILVLRYPVVHQRDGIAGTNGNHALVCSGGM